MKRILKRIKDIGEAVSYEIVDFLLSFGGTDVMLTLSVASMLITIYIGFKIPWELIVSLNTA